MIRVRKHYGDNVIIFGVSTTQSRNIKVVMVELNGLAVSSGRMFRAKSYLRVQEWLENVVVDEEFCVKYRVHKRIEPNPPKKGNGYERVKVFTLHLRKWSPVTNNYERTGISSHFYNLLKGQMYGVEDGLRYDIEVGAVKFVNIALDERGKAAINGLARADISTPLTMKKGGGKSKKIVKATMKMR